MSMPTPPHPGPTKVPPPDYETNWAALYGAAGFGVLLVAAIVVSHQLSGNKPAAARPSSGDANVVAAVVEAETVEVVRQSEAAVAKVPTALTDQQPAIAPVPPDVPVARIPVVVAKEFAPAVAQRPRENSFADVMVAQSDADNQWDNQSRFVSPRGESELLARLQQYTPVLALDSVEGSADHLLGKSMSDEFGRPSSKESTLDKAASAPGAARLQGLLAWRSDLRGLPFRMGDECVADKEEIRKKASASDTIGRVKGMLFRRRVSMPSETYMVKVAHTLSHFVGEFRDGGHVSVLVQMLQADSVPIRQQLVEQLATVDAAQSWARQLHNVAKCDATGKARDPESLSTENTDYRARVALARLSVFDLSPEVRKTALAVLRNHEADTFRHELLAALRYPWPPVADHAAAALVVLNDVGCVPELVDMLDEPDPRAPFRSEENEWVVQELVGVNHLRNCLLCHPPANSPDDRLRGLIPTPGKPIPVAYYHSSQGDFVRADVTFLRQDFSVSLPVENHGPWPREQRFDFMIRTRPATHEELATRGSVKSRPENRYPQREAVLYALRELTGEDFGEETGPWREFARAYQTADATAPTDADE